MDWLHSCRPALALAQAPDDSRHASRSEYVSCAATREALLIIDPSATEKVIRPSDVLFCFCSVRVCGVGLVRCRCVVFYREMGSTGLHCDVVSDVLVLCIVMC